MYKNPFQIQIYSTPEAIAKVATLMVEMVQKTPVQLNLGLPTGSTFAPIYQAVVSYHHQYKLDWSKTTTFNLDEYLGYQPSNPQSYHAFMQQSLFAHINILPQHIHFPTEFLTDPTKYDQLMTTHGGLDAIFLGLGINGHIAFNEPGTLITSKTHIVDLSLSTIKRNAELYFQGDESLVATKAITMGIATILNAKKIYLVAFGSEKAKIIQQLLTAEINTTLPATFLYCHTNVTLILDHAAACLLDKTTNIQNQR